jgi:DNA-directed RNA polymerase specialized sigma24 family protein
VIENNSFNKDCLIKLTTSKNETCSQVEIEFLIEELSKKLTSRQAMILRLKILDNISQIEISKILGFSEPTISIEMRKIRSVIKKLI